MIKNVESALRSHCDTVEKWLLNLERASLDFPAEVLKSIKSRNFAVVCSLCRGWWNQICLLNDAADCLGTGLVLHNYDIFKERTPNSDGIREQKSGKRRTGESLDNLRHLLLNSAPGVRKRLRIDYDSISHRIQDLISRAKSLRDDTVRRITHLSAARKLDKDELRLRYESLTITFKSSCPSLELCTCNKLLIPINPNPKEWEKLSFVEDRNTFATFNGKLVKSLDKLFHDIKKKPFNTSNSLETSLLSSSGISVKDIQLECGRDPAEFEKNVEIRDAENIVESSSEYESSDDGATGHERRGHYHKALAIYEQDVETLRKEMTISSSQAFIDVSLDLAGSLRDLGRCLGLHQEFHKAKKALKESVDICRNKYDNDITSRVAEELERSELELGNLWLERESSSNLKQSDYLQAEVHYRNSLKLCEDAVMIGQRVFSPSALLRASYNLGLVLQLKDQTNEAMPYLEKAVSEYDQLFRLVEQANKDNDTSDFAMKLRKELKYAALIKGKATLQLAIEIGKNDPANASRKLRGSIDLFRYKANTIELMEALKALADLIRRSAVSPDEKMNEQLLNEAVAFCDEGISVVEENNSKNDQEIVQLQKLKDIKNEVMLELNKNRNYQRSTGVNLVHNIKKNTSIIFPAHRISAAPSSFHTVNSANSYRSLQRKKMKIGALELARVGEKGKQSSAVNEKLNNDESMMQFCKTFRQMRDHSFRPVLIDGILFRKEMNIGNIPDFTKCKMARDYISYCQHEPKEDESLSAVNMHLVQKLTEAELKGHIISSLDVSSCRITNFDLKWLMPTLTCQAALSNFNISGNFKISKVISYSTGILLFLKYLDLSRCGLQLCDFIALEKVSEGSPTLCDFILKDNMLWKCPIDCDNEAWHAGAYELGRFIQSCKHLRHLDLSGNFTRPTLIQKSWKEIVVKFISGLANAISNSIEVTFLGLEKFCLPKTAWDLLFKALKGNMPRILELTSSESIFEENESFTQDLSCWSLIEMAGISSCQSVEFRALNSRSLFSDALPVFTSFHLLVCLELSHLDSTAFSQIIALSAISFTNLRVLCLHHCHPQLTSSVFKHISALCHGNSTRNSLDFLSLRCCNIELEAIIKLVNILIPSSKVRVKHQLVVDLAHNCMHDHQHSEHFYAALLKALNEIQEKYHESHQNTSSLKLDLTGCNIGVKLEEHGIVNSTTLSIIM